MHELEKAVARYHKDIREGKYDPSKASLPPAKRGGTAKPEQKR